MGRMLPAASLLTTPSLAIALLASVFAPDRFSSTDPRPVPATLA